MRKIADIRKDLSAAIAEARLIDASKAENAEALKKALDKIDDLTAELNAANRVEAAEQAIAAQRFSDKEAKKGERFSFLKFIRECIDGQLTGIEAEAAAEGAKEYQRLGLAAQGRVIPTFILARAAAGQNYTTAADGGNLIEEMSAKYTEALRNKLVVAGLGATVLTNLVGTLPVIGASDISASWLAEGADVSVSKAAFAKATMTPHRNSAMVAFTKDLLRQTSLDVEALLYEKLMNAHAQLIETAAIAGTGANNQPTGILNTTGIGSVAMGTNGGAITWAKVVELETKVNENNANKGKLAYLTNAKVNGALKTVQKGTNLDYILSGANPNMLNGYKYDFSNVVPAGLTKGTGTGLSAMIFGNWEDLWIGEWGGMDLVVDPYTLAASAQVRLVMNCWNDIKVVEPKSFAAIQDINA
ncbi:MAG: phage major capsid protein [Clostridia bacterium]|nr:phage major capsid protein [Clostridia bacterium]